MKLLGITLPTNSFSRIAVGGQLFRSQSSCADIVSFGSVLDLYKEGTQGHVVKELLEMEVRGRLEICNEQET